MIPPFSPMPLERRREPFDHPDWLFELKYDGFRALAYVLGGKPRLVSRNDRDFKRFDDLRDELEINADAAVLDGEICCLDESDRPLFFDLMRRRGRPVFVSFDLLWLNGRDVRELTLTKRKTILRAIVPERSPSILYAHHVKRDGQALFETICRHDLEGSSRNSRADATTPRRRRG